MNRRIAALLKDRISEYTYVDRLAGLDLATQLKMDGNDKYRPGWFRLSDEEVRLLASQSSERVAALASRILTQ